MGQQPQLSSSMLSLGTGCQAPNHTAPRAVTLITLSERASDPLVSELIKFNGAESKHPISGGALSALATANR